MSEQDPPEYYTLAAPTTGTYKEKGSKFYAYAYPIGQREDVDRRMQEVRAQYPDARHVVHAWRIGNDMLASDDGEPANSSGPPVLRQIQSHEITHAACMVVRYFGGVKLGVAGLIRAYGTAAADALAKAEIIPYIKTTTCWVTYAYDDTAAVERTLRQFDTETLESEYTAQCRLQLQLPLAQYDAFAEAIGTHAEVSK